MYTRRCHPDRPVAKCHVDRLSPPSHVAAFRGARRYDDPLDPDVAILSMIAQEDVATLVGIVPTTQQYAMLMVMRKRQVDDDILVDGRLPVVLQFRDPARPSSSPNSLVNTQRGTIWNTIGEIVSKVP